MDHVDVAVIGAGFGGLGAALTLAEGGARVALYEALRYPGGCASTFVRGGRRYESGATLSSGFNPAQPFARWIDRHGLDVRTEVLDPVIALRAPGLSLDVPPDREALLARFTALSPGRGERLRAFFDAQRTAAGSLWSLFDEPQLLPPFGWRSLATHARRAHRYLPIARWIARPLADVVDAFGLTDFEPLRIYLDAICQITVQARCAEAEAPFALAAMDYPFRGTRHVVGGFGALAEGLVHAFVALGGTARFSDAVQSLAHDGEGWLVRSRRGELRARHIVANLLPQDLATLTHLASPVLDDLATRVASGWGAAMLYLTLRADAPVGAAAQHRELIADPTRPFTEGNHIFVSLSAEGEDRGPGRVRTATVSTHVPMPVLDALDAAAQGRYIDGVQRSMRATLASLAPDLDAAVTQSMTGSPRTFARFTRRAHGYVGGIPRRAGLENYRALTAPQVAEGLHLVGDSVFPGQSALGVAIGGLKVAERILRSA